MYSLRDTATRRPIDRRILPGLLLLTLLVSSAANGQVTYETGRAAFSVAVNNEIYPYREFSVFVMPRERTVIRVLDDTNSRFLVDLDGLNLEATDDKRWIWHTPGKPTHSKLTIRRELDGESISLSVLVMVPASQMRDGVLNGYKIGQYPEPVKDVPIYDRPKGFIEVRQSDMELRLSPHFVLGQFVSDRSTVFPKYIVLRERLLLKLEAILQRLNEQNMVADSLAILSGYRTPLMNQQIGGAEYSRHLYGGAAAVIIDTDPVDGLMDDVNSDGISNWEDVQKLFNLVNLLTKEPAHRHLQGGLALYRGNERRGPYLQLDARGVRARWNADLDKQRFVSPNKPLTKSLE